MKPFSILFIILFFFTHLNAQINPKTKWGEVSQAEIDYKQVSFEKEAPAVVLYESGDMTIARLDNQNITYRRIKILNEEGKKFANQELFYQDIYEFDEMRYIKAQSINIVDGKEIKTPVKNSEIYDVEINGSLKSKRFAIPNVTVGSIIEIEYTYFSKNNYFLDPWQFQHDIPTLYSSFQINVQAAVEYMPICNGEKIVKYARENKKLKDHRNIWIIKDLPSIKKINFVYNKKDAAEKIFFQLKGYTNINLDHINEMISWIDLNKKIIEYDSKNIDAATVKRISLNISPGQNEIDQVEKILSYIRKNYVWNDNYSPTSSKSIVNLEQSKQGNSADLNLLLNQLLLEKNIYSELVLISLRENGRVKRVFPFSNQFNTYINLITLQNGETFFVDATYPVEEDYKFIPLNNYNQYGLILNRSKERFIAMNPLLSEYHSIQNYIYKDGKFLLIRSEKRNGYFKENLLNLSKELERYNSQPNSLDIFTTEKRRDTKDSDENKFELERILFESVPISDLDFISIENPLKAIVSEFQFEENTRERALEFNFPFYYKTDVIIDIPENFNIEIPINFNTKKEISSKELIYYQNAELKENKLIFHIEFYLAKSVFDSNYTEIKSFFDKINLDASKEILLKKS